MSTVLRQHVEWLSLIETSGPFLSLPVLTRAFPQGLPPHDPDRHALLRQALDEWQDRLGTPEQPAYHRAFLLVLLTRVLDLPPSCIIDGPALPPSLVARVAEHQVQLRPDLAIINPPSFQSSAPALGRNTAPGAPRVLVQIYPPDQDLLRPARDPRWSASPASRLVELCHQCGVRLGLAWNGRRLLFVDARPGVTTGFASFFPELLVEEKLTLQALQGILGPHRLFGVADPDLTESLLDESAKDQQEVTDQLGRQVLAAVELLIQALSRCDRATPDAGSSSLLAGVPEAELYRGALTVMMRLCFLLCAEERRLLPAGHDLYDQGYAASTLGAELRRAADHGGEELLERRHDAWARLLALFRAVHGGVRYHDLSIPAYGGDLFDPDRFPFLEGRPKNTSWRTTPARPLPIHNRTVLHLLEALQRLTVRLPGGPAESRRLSFRALGIEQIGHVYEGLLDHTAVRASGPVLALTSAAYCASGLTFWLLYNRSRRRLSSQSRAPTG